ncbi:MAG: hypothetical protein GY757_40650 [bacterium]|nr:hypothetical protein [bacterium]
MNKSFKRNIATVSLILAIVCLMFGPLAADGLYKNSTAVVKGTVSINGEERPIDITTKETYDPEKKIFYLEGRDRYPREDGFIIDPGWRHVSGLIGEIEFLRAIGDRGVAKTTFGKYGTLVDEFVLTGLDPIVIEHRFSGSLSGVPAAKFPAEKLDMEFLWFKNGNAFGMATYRAPLASGETVDVPVTYDINFQSELSQGFNSVNSEGTRVLAARYEGWAKITSIDMKTGEYRGEFKYTKLSHLIQPVADGHQVLRRKIGIVTTLGRGVDDHRVILADHLESVEVSSLQWTQYKTDELADILTVTGVEPNVSWPLNPPQTASVTGEAPMVYSAVRGFKSGDIKELGEQVLDLAGEIYTTSGQLMSKKELEANFPGMDFSRLAPVEAEALYCVSLWKDIKFANGKPLNSTWIKVDPATGCHYNYLTHIMREEFRFKRTTRDPSDFEDFILIDNIEAVGSHFHRVFDGGGRGNSVVLSIIGIAGAEVSNPWKNISGFKREQIKINSNSLLVDAVGNIHISEPRLMTKENIAKEFAEMKLDLTNLKPEGLYMVDQFGSPENSVDMVNFKYK